MLEKINHVFTVVTWEELYPLCLHSITGAALSGNCPLLLDLDVKVKTGRRLRIECFSPKVGGFFDVVSGAWNSIPGSGNPLRVLDDKLKDKL